MDTEPPVILQPGRHILSIHTARGWGRTWRRRLPDHLWRMHGWTLADLHGVYVVGPPGTDPSRCQPVGEASMDALWRAHADLHGHALKWSAGPWSHRHKSNMLP